MRLKHSHHENSPLLLPDQKQPCHSIIGYHCHQIVYRGDQGTGCHCRVYLDLMENMGITVPTALEIAIATKRETPTQPEIPKAPIQVYPLNRCT